MPIRTDSIELAKEKLLFCGTEAQLSQIPYNDRRCYWRRYFFDCSIYGVFYDAVPTLDYTL